MDHHYLDYYNNRRIKAKLEELATCNSQAASPFSCFNNFHSKILSNFLGAPQGRWKILILEMNLGSTLYYLI